MKTQQSPTAPKRTLRKDLAMFGNVRVLTAAALLAAMSLILGKFLQIPNPLSDIFRISFENLPVIFAGFCFGPVVGGTVGAVADIVGCLLYGYTINPIITLGAAAVGIVSGIMANYIVKRPRWLSIAAATFAAHAVGSVVVKSLGLAAWYLSSYNMGLVELMLWRALLYAVIGTAEFLLIYLLTSHRAVAGIIERLRTLRS
ncbi:MAG: folate family ECF transporter S component [Clostridia bacterium]|nr:folate family ECF transporter S component [Clostridia bacterium]